MSDELAISGRQYISSKRASELSGYSQDYIGQLSRGGAIEARRIGGLWYISRDSLLSYKEKAETYVPQPPVQDSTREPETFVSFDGKDYVSASRAAQITGYHQDYVGQLARGSKIPSRQIGNRWYVDREAIVDHKGQKDALLGAVQSESAGVHVSEPTGPSASQQEPFYTYKTEVGEPLPKLTKGEPRQERVINVAQYSTDLPPTAKAGRIGGEIIRKQSMVRTPGKSMSLVAFASAALTITIVVTVGYVSLKAGSLYTLGTTYAGQNTANVGSTGAAAIASRLAQDIEAILAPQISYQRANK